jgi:hypothetical protein
MALAILPEKKEAVTALLAHDAVPNNDPVIEGIVAVVETFREFRAASDPDTMTFLQFGIFITFLRLDAQKLTEPTSLSGQQKLYINIKFFSCLS